MNFLESVGFLAIMVVVWIAYLSNSKVRLAPRLEGALIIITLFAIYSVLASVWAGVTNIFVVSTPTPLPNNAKPPPTPNRPMPTATPSCLLWSQITPQMQGRTACIYGTVTDHRENWDNFLTNIYFAGDFGTPAFFLVSTDRFNPLEGTCVTTTGKIELNTYNTPYIKVNLQTLYLCK